jgi:hypothetical protein
MAKVLISFISLLIMTSVKIFELENLSEGLRVPPIVAVLLASRDESEDLNPRTGGSSAYFLDHFIGI